LNDKSKGRQPRFPVAVVACRSSGDVVTQLTERVVSAPDGFVGQLVALERRLAGSGAPVRVTWLNHHSIRVALEVAPEAVGAVDVCGIDGQFLQWLLRHPVRTSADLVVPRLLTADPTIGTVLAIGGQGDRSDVLSAALTREAGRPVTAKALDGFLDLPRGNDLRRLVREVRPDLVLVGLGAGLQEQVLLEAASAMPRGYALTCGGFLDQVLQEGYYPGWAYPLHLNWLVRLAREPRRLWRRYTVEALSAVASRGDWRTSLAGVPGVAAHERMCLGGTGLTPELGAA
jgi:UDP-N-acetyl-D-mannosaminuronic acid transferase (WecB/TagA/CpsF family)